MLAPGKCLNFFDGHRGNVPYKNRLQYLSSQEFDMASLL